MLREDKLDLTTIDFRQQRTYSLNIRSREPGQTHHIFAIRDRNIPRSREIQGMTTFDNRKDAAEKKFAHDAELQFKANARRNKLLGQWVAGQLGLAGTEAEAYAKSVVMSDFEEAGDEDVFRKVTKDLAAAKIEVSEHVVRRTMDELMAKAITEIQAGT